MGKKYDGCTGFPDGFWVECCDEHDIDYEKGGTWRERRDSDRRLRECVKGKFLTRYRDRIAILFYLESAAPDWALLLGFIVGWMMYLGVRIMGSPYMLPLYLWPRWRKQARWGFGR